MLQQITAVSSEPNPKLLNTLKPTHDATDAVLLTKRRRVLPLNSMSTLNCQDAGEQ